MPQDASEADRRSCQGLGSPDRCETVRSAVESKSLAIGKELYESTSSDS
jgi:hypothetical protein